MTVGHRTALVTVIVPVYNAARTIERCLKSILEQRFTDFELVIIDDGSTDESLGICEGFAKEDSRVRVIHQENGGPGRARNVGIQNARGEWITFIDSDDWVENLWLEGFVGAISEERSLIIQGFSCLEKQKISTVALDLRLFKNDSRAAVEYLFSKYALGFVWNKIFRLKLILDANVFFNENYSIREDEEFVMNYVAKNGQCIQTTKEYGYRYSMPDYSAKYQKKMNMECLFDFIGHLCSLPGDINFNRSVFDRYFIEICANAAWNSQVTDSQRGVIVKKIFNIYSTYRIRVPFKSPYLFLLNTMYACGKLWQWEAVFKIVSIIISFGMGLKSAIKMLSQGRVKVV